MTASDTMSTDTNPIDQSALDGLSVAPNAGNQERDPRQDAGQDRSIAKRLQRDPENVDAKLDNGLDESMDASDPPASTQPTDNSEPPASSGYDAEAERLRSDTAS